MIILRTMLLTVTPNPSLDLLFTADRLAWDDANRVPMPRRRPGGQGVNLVRAARALETAQALAIMPLGGSVGDELGRMLRDEGTPLVPVPAPGETRVFVGVRERSEGRALLLNPRGPVATAELEEALFAAVVAELDRSGPTGPRWLACCGSLLPGLSTDFYGRLGTEARRRGWFFVPDCDGDALREAAHVADLLVPNVHEAERLLGMAIPGVEEAAAAARSLLDLGATVAVVTLGADGAVAATRHGCCRARLELESPSCDALRSELAEGSAVGAGDSFLAALLLDLDPAGAPDDALAAAVATGTAALLSRGDDLVRREDVARIRPHVRLEPMPG